MIRKVTYNTDVNGFPIGECNEEFNIAELKQITESSNIKADADPNKLHYDELKKVTYGYTDEEARVVAKVLAEDKPWILFDALRERMNNMHEVLFDIADVMRTVNKND